MPSSSGYYRHTQAGRIIIVPLAALCLIAAVLLIQMQDAMSLMILLVAAVPLLLFPVLTVVVGDGAVHVSFGVGLIRRRIPLRRIRAAKPVRTPWYFGWGIRITPRGWLWRVSGVDGVELQFDDGHRFTIGSDEPERLAEAIRAQSTA